MPEILIEHADYVITVDAERLLLLRNVEIDDIRNADGLGENEPRAGRRDVADEAVERGAAVVEIDAATQKALFARGRSALDPALVLAHAPGLPAVHTAARVSASA